MRVPFPTSVTSGKALLSTLIVALAAACAAEDDRPKRDFTCTAGCRATQANPAYPSSIQVETMSIRAPDESEAKMACFDEHADCPPKAGWIEVCDCQAE